MKIPFVDKIKKLETKLNEANTEIDWLVDNKHKFEKKFALIETLLKQGELGKATKKRMIITIRHVINT